MPKSDSGGQPRQFLGPTYLVCEGPVDGVFFSRLTDHYGLQGFDIHNPSLPDDIGAHGKDGFERLLRAIRVGGTRPNASIKRILIFTDADDNPQKASKTHDAPYVRQDSPYQKSRLGFKRGK